MADHDGGRSFLDDLQLTEEGFQAIERSWLEYSPDALLMLARVLGVVGRSETPTHQQVLERLRRDLRQPR